MVYLLGAVSSVYTDIKNAINSDPNLTLVYDDGVDDLICTHDGLGIAIKFEDVDNRGPSIFVGLSYTAGINVDNPYQVAWCKVNYSMLDGYLIVDSDYIIIAERYNADHYYYLAIGQSTNNDVIVIGNNGNSTSYHTAQGYDITNQRACEAMMVSAINGSGIVVDGNYAKMPLYIGLGNQVFLDGTNAPIKMKKFDILFRPALIGQPVEPQNTDVILNATKTKSGILISGGSIIGTGLFQ